MEHLHVALRPVASVPLLLTRSEVSGLLHLSLPGLPSFNPTALSSLCLWSQDLPGGPNPLAPLESSQLLGFAQAVSPGSEM